MTEPMELSRGAIRRVLFLVGFAAMLFQMGLLRELRYQLSAHYTLAPFLFSAVIVLIGVGSLAASFWKNSAPLVAGVMTALPAVMIPAYGATVYIARHNIDRTVEMNYTKLTEAVGAQLSHLDSVALPFVLVALLGYGIVFVLQGMLFAALFREGRKAGHLSGSYAIDLFASAIGAIVGGFLVYRLDPIGTAGLAALVLLAALWLTRGQLAISRRETVVSTILTLAGAAAILPPADLAGTATPPQLAGLVPTWHHWSPYRRIDILENEANLSVLTDGLVFHSHSKVDEPSRNPVSIPISLIPKVGNPKVLIIGAGTGSDIGILRKMHGDRVQVTGVELDEGFIIAARQNPYLNELMGDAEIIVQEGRYFLESTDRRFDAIIFAYIDPQSAVSRIGVPDANFLYTVEGLRAAYDRLEPGGLLVVTRLFLVSEEESFNARLFATLEEAGFLESASVYRWTTDLPWGYYGKISFVQAYITKDGGPMAIDSEALERRFPDAEDLASVRPTTDSFPFSLETGVWFGLLVDYVVSNKLLVVLLGLFALVLLLRLATSRAHSIFFMLGFGSFLVESLVLVQSFLLLGNPTLSAALAIGAFLFWNALGSALSDRVENWRPFPWIAAASVVAHAATMPFVMSATIGESPVLRMSVFAAHLGIVGVPVGAMFPMALRIFRDGKVSALFAIDLLGCGLAPVAFWLAMSYQGMPLASAAAAASYVLVATLLIKR